MKAKSARRSGQFLTLALCVSALVFTGCYTPPQRPLEPTLVSKWERFEAVFYSTTSYSNPFQSVDLTVKFVAPDGEQFVVPAFWNGGYEWRVRFSPTLAGPWRYETMCSDDSNRGLHARKGEFLCTAPLAETVFSTHGPIGVARDGRHLIHEDLKPFFWLGDTAWNGALKSTREDWKTYLDTRAEQKFTAVQWVATQWRAAPDGDINGTRAFSGKEKIELNLEFFNRLDQKAAAVANVGMLNAPVLLWAIGGGSNPGVNPGFSLPEDQAIKLARYMVARWQAFPVIWILAGDGDYTGQKAERWKRIGRGVFGNIYHAPTMLHPGGQQWNLPAFLNEDWLDMIGYQSGHGDSDETFRWIYDGPPAKDWTLSPDRPFINLEPCYENHIAYQSKKPHTASDVRNAMYWSLLNSPTAGVSYGGHGVWGWDNGITEPTDHSGTGIPLAWNEAMKMEAAGQVRHINEFITKIAYWKLRPAPEMLSRQPGNELAEKHISISRSEDGDFGVAYVPADRSIDIYLDQLPPRPQISWFNPRTGETSASVGVVSGSTLQMPTPSEGDWLLLIRTGR